MSVKFEKETIRDTPIPGGRKHELAHEIGERLTGGESQAGYLTVSGGFPVIAKSYADRLGMSDVPQTAPDQPSPYKDAHIWILGSCTRGFGILDRSR